MIHESFKIDENSILNQDEKLEEETVKLFEDKFSGLAENLKHFGETDVLEFGMNEKRSEKMNAEYPLKMKITFAVDLEGDPAEIAKERQKFVGYPSAKHCRNLEKHQDQEYKHE